MARFGRNVKMTAPQTKKEAMRHVFESVFGCERASPNDTIDLFGFEEGASIAVDYVPADSALTPSQHRKRGTWLELAVDDAPATVAALEAAPDVERFTFVTGHAYFQLPGGQVVRLED